MRTGRVQLEIVQRTSGNIPNEFPIFIREDQASQDDCAYGLGSMRLVANLNTDPNAISTAGMKVVEDAAKDILVLAKSFGKHGVSLSDITVNTPYNRAVVNAAVKKLIREDGVLYFTDAEDIPDKKVLMVKGQMPLETYHGQF
jgi:hypothetical protein